MHDCFTFGNTVAWVKEFNHLFESLTSDDVDWSPYMKSVILSITSLFVSGLYGISCQEFAMPGSGVMIKLMMRPFCSIVDEPKERYLSFNI